MTQIEGVATHAIRFQGSSEISAPDGELLQYGDEVIAVFRARIVGVNYIESPSGVTKMLNVLKLQELRVADGANAEMLQDFLASDLDDVELTFDDALEAEVSDAPAPFYEVDPSKLSPSVVESADSDDDEESQQGEDIETVLARARERRAAAAAAVPDVAGRDLAARGPKPLRPADPILRNFMDDPRG